MSARSTLFGMRNICDWGEKAWSQEDDRPCGQVAAGVVAVRDPGGVRRLDLCSVHRAVLLEQTAPVLDP